MAVFAVVKCVEWQKIEEKAAVMEGQGVEVVRSTKTGVYLLAYFEDEKRDRNYLQGKIFKAWLALCKQLCRNYRKYNQHQECRCYLV